MSGRAPTDEELADLAAAVLVVARKLSIRSEQTPGAIALTNTEAEVMRTVHRTPGLTVTQVAARTGLQRSNVSAILAVLTRHALVVKERSATDRRATVLRATAAAVANLDRVRDGWADRLRQVDAAALADAVAAQGALARLAARMDDPAAG